MIPTAHHILNAGRSRGAATLFAVIMLAVMFTLSAALWTGVSASRRMSRNDRDSLRAMAATETGMNYLNSALARIKVRDSESAGQGVIRKWRSSMSYVNGIGSRDNDTCLVFPDIIPHPGSSQSFTATLTVIGAPDAAKPSVCMRVTGTDRASGLKRHIVANLNPLDTTDRIFRYGVASKGRVDLAKGKSNLLGSPNDAGSILSTYPNAWAIWLAGGTISGDVAVVNDPATSFINNGGTVGGTVLQVDPPDFPEFCGNQYYSSSLRQLPGNNNSGPFSNVRITSDFTFNGNDVIQGLIYVKPGVTVSFKGNPVVHIGSAPFQIRDVVNGSVHTIRAIRPEIKRALVDLSRSRRVGAVVAVDIVPRINDDGEVVGRGANNGWLCPDHPRRKNTIPTTGQLFIQQPGVGDFCQSERGSSEQGTGGVGAFVTPVLFHSQCQLLDVHFGAVSAGQPVHVPNHLEGGRNQ